MRFALSALPEARPIPNEQELIAAAKRARANAYARYSNFAVGAAALSADGEITVGCNVENASFGLTVCAERVAIFAAIANGHRRVAKLAVSVSDLAVAPSERMPCGACLQVMAEFMDPGGEIIVEQVGKFKLQELLSRPFRLSPPSP